MNTEDVELERKLTKPKHSNQLKKAVGFRFLVWTVIALGVSLLFYALSAATGKNDTVGLTVIIGTPIMVGALVAYLSELVSAGSSIRSAVYVGAAVFILGTVILREAIICIIMLAFLWWPLVFLGAFFVKFLFDKEIKRKQLFSLNLIALPILTLIIDAVVPMPIESRRVTREIIIEAPVTRVWDNLHDIPDITEGDGRWNITQDVLGLPRPEKAATDISAAGSVRTNYWAKGIAFEEHITETKKDERLYWEFVFPDDSLRHKTDPHLDPSSHYFHIDEGGFDLTAIDATSTRLVLHTQYIMQTPVNGYSALWGEIFLGDIQNNVLAVIKTRSERAE